MRKLSKINRLRAERIEVQRAIERAKNVEIVNGILDRFDRDEKRMKLLYGAAELETQNSRPGWLARIFG